MSISIDKGTKRRGRTHRLDSICRRICVLLRCESERTGAKLGAHWVAGQGRALPLISKRKVSEVAADG